MKLIATLATLAALVGQTEAAVTAKATIKALHDTKAYTECADKVSVEFVVATATTAVTEVKVKLPTQFKLSAAFAALTHVDSFECFNTATPSASAALTITDHSFDATTQVLFFKTPAAGCNLGKAILMFKNVCNREPTVDGTKYVIAKGETAAAFMGQDGGTGALTLVTADSAKVEGLKNGGTVTASGFPIKAGEKGTLKITFTSQTAVSTSDKITLNMPTGYIILDTTVCKVGVAGSEANLPAVSGDQTTTYTWTTTAASITAAANVFLCEIKAPATVPAFQKGGFSLKYGGTANPTDAVYADFATLSPTKSPTKAADSPASVATASGVVVGALGVAALFLA